MKGKLENIGEVQLLVRSLYDKVLKDNTLSPYFSNVLEHNWERHLTGMVSFWGNVLLLTGDYLGNPLQVHKMMHQFKKLEPSAFERYIHLFDKTVNELFKGEKAELAKERVSSIAKLMKQHIMPKQS